MDNDLEQNAIFFLDLASRLRQLGSDASPPEKMRVSPSHLALIDYVERNPACGIQEMAEALHLSTPTVSVSVRQLEKSELVARKRNPEDGRAVQLSLTPKGKEIHKSIQAFHRQKFKTLLEGLTPREREMLITLLEKALNAAENKF
jgi:DNA-binding MarR family transcriptional regulator